MRNAQKGRHGTGSPISGHRYEQAASYREGLPPGSYLALSHGCADDATQDVIRDTAAVYDQATAPLVLRTRAQISRFFGGFEPVNPGLVHLPLWRPDGLPPDPQEAARTGMFGGVGRKGGQGPQGAPGRG